MTTYRTIFLSDLHLGMRGCQAERVLDFVRHHQAERWVLVGDVVDGWALARSWQWTQAHNDVVQKLLREVRKGAEMVYVPGNHDGAARQFAGLTFGGILVQREWTHVTADGRRLLVLHGDEFDGVVRLAPWLSRVGARAYELSLALNTVVAAVRERMGVPYWSLAAALKDRTKRALQYVDRFEEAVAALAAERGVDGVVCGHIHRPEVRTIETEGGPILYANCGDWVENCTALVEHWDGRLEIVRWTGALGPVAEPRGDGVAALAPRLALSAEAAGLGLRLTPLGR
ncbi:UDP-2,3-diacylglucosamine diphosphatase [Rubrivirga sp.]|uniref:UDP-2,3-diacylglucosamine diphosphatase n=1 Tax=Rubrivirga sp. TaxID=1885344 RepID=UPI003B52E87B